MFMSSGDIIAGDFPEKSFIISVFGDISIHCQTIKNPSFKHNITKDIKSVEIITEETKKKFLGAAGWGAVGAIALGPLGAIAGVLAGGNKKELLIACELKDGKKFIATVDNKLYKTMLKVSY